MDAEADFLEGYDPAVFPPVAVTVDLVLTTVEAGALSVLLARREEPPFERRWALPGGFVGPEESLDEAARRILAGKAHLEGAWIEQLYTFGAPGRDPRMRVITVAYFALLPAERLKAAVADAVALRLASVGEAPLGLAFDHDEIVATAVRRLRGKLDYTPIAFSLLPDRFTLRALQHVHEAILGRRVNKSAFRRRMLESAWLRPTGERETGASFRPAELYTFHPSA
ncbi:MAG TPA: NUDIX domain-containing protein [Allosphingosinicella sp.]|jgi:8-oxo-dGTP diphosphatase